MLVTLAGLGCGTAATMTAEAAEAIREADCLLGAGRLLAAVPENGTAKRVEATRPGQILEALLESGAERPCVVYSGDTGFYSGARGLLALLEAEKIAYRVLPGISSVQLLAARLGRPWQDWTLCSAHGTDCDPVTAVSQGKPVFFLTGGALGPVDLCRRLTEAGLGGLEVTVGENLSYETEHILRGTAGAFATRTFAPLSVLLAEAAPVSQEPRAPGLPDDAFLRGKVPMTKQEVRTAALGKLALRPTDTVWDVGAGTGSVSVELALAARYGRTYAVECQEEACELIRANRQRFGTWNLTLIQDKAPEALADLPAPDAVFIGGTKGNMDAVLDMVLGKNPGARICISAIALETLSAAVTALTAHGLTAEVTQIGVSRTKTAGKLHLLMANNPVFLISAGPSEAVL